MKHETVFALAVTSVLAAPLAVMGITEILTRMHP